MRLAEAPSHGLPVIAYDRRSAGAEAYWKVAMELVERRLSTAQRGLGRGLEVLIGGADASRSSRTLPVDTIHPNPRQPRRRFDHEATAGARRVDPGAGGHPAGRRPAARRGRLRADRRRAPLARCAGGGARRPSRRSCARPTTATRCCSASSRTSRASSCRRSRRRARTRCSIDEFGLSLGEVAERVGRSKPSVSNRLRLLELPDDVLGMVERGELTEGHARAVLAVPDHEGRRRLAREIVRRGLSVRAAERAARWAGAATKPRKAPPVDPALAERVKVAAERLTGFRARVSARGLEIPFAARSSSRSWSRRSSGEAGAA